ncbi:hypothetical protein [Streptomyces zhaozhouensis]|uniref:hypothetical protein n=1 Tax=Streptomyces zhaozhouensis TaxID=1300267 RepID=UPI001BAED1DC|nr:hypothetical protein [Streptomyces zhaozhouensis]
MTVRQLSRWENRSPPPLPYPAQQQVLEAVLGLPLQDLGFVVPQHRRTTAPVGHDGEVRRRNLVLGVPSGIAAAALLPALSGRVGAGDVARVRAELAALYQVDHQHGGIPAQARAAALAQHITHALDTAALTPSVARDLETTLAELACHRAWFSYDGPENLARAASTEAITTTQLTDHPLLQARALATHSLVAMRTGRRWEARSAVERAHQLARTAGAGPTVHLVIALREAGAATRAGDQTTARRALSRATHHHARVDHDQDVPAWARFAGQVEVDYATAAWHRHGGRPAKAIPFLRAAVAQLGAGYTRNSTWYRSRLAITLLEAGDIEEACAEIDRVLDTAGQVASRRLRSRLGEFAAAAATTGAAAATDPVDRIRALLREAA